MRKNMIYNISINAILLGLLIISSKIIIPIGVIPMTLQTIAIAFISLILNKKNALIVISIYICLGLIGLPVFSTSVGFTIIYSPSFGFLLGFLFSVFGFNFAKKQKRKEFQILFLIISLLIIYIFGSFYTYFIFTFYLNIHSSFIYIINITILPFIIKDLISISIAYIVYLRLNPILNLKVI